MKTIPLLSICLALVPTATFANGGGYFRGGVAKSGNVELFEPSGTDKVAILDEELIITARPNGASVRIRYQMKNISDKPVKVEFGFPIEEMKERKMFPGEGTPEKATPKKLEYCRNYKISLSDTNKTGAEFRSKELTTKMIDEPFGEIDSFARLTGWLVSTASFAAGEEKTMTIAYESDYPRDVSYVSDRSHTAAGVFAYRLSTGACWAGPIKHGRVVIEAWEYMDPREIKVMKPVNRFEKQGNRWVWEFKDLEPTLADDLQIEMDPEEHTYEVKVGEDKYDNSKRSAKRGDRWEVVHTNYTVKASSTLPPETGHSYEASKVREWGCWAEGAKGNGVGEWLELKPDVPGVLRAITIAPGFGRSDGLRENLYEANGRPKRAKLELNGEKSYEIEFTDDKIAQRFFLPDYAKPVEKIKLTFLEVYPGSRYEDLCVSRIELVSGLSKAPKVGPIR